MRKTARDVALTCKRDRGVRAAGTAVPQAPLAHTSCGVAVVGRGLLGWACNARRVRPYRLTARCAPTPFSRVLETVPSGGERRG